MVSENSPFNARTAKFDRRAVDFREGVSDAAPARSSADTAFGPCPLATRRTGRAG